MRRALGVYAGIGAMLIAFQRSGWKVLGNLESRKIHTYREDKFSENTFEQNFDAPLLSLEEEDIGSQDIDLIAAQPKCGGFSQLYGTGRKPTDVTTAREEYGKGIIETIKKIGLFRPKYFYVENLIKSLLVVTPEMWRDLLPEYNLQFEQVSNWHYGNPQKGRVRMYVIGCHKDLDFIFIPQETKNGCTVAERIGDLFQKEDLVPNHDRHSREDTDNITNLAKSNRWEDIAELVRDMEEGKNIPYRAKDGTIKRRIGSTKLYWKKHSHTLAGIKGAKFHPLTGYPISIRERCRLQGYPDDFIIYGTRFNDDGTWSLRRNGYPVRQLNNTVPYEFTEEFCRQLNYYIDNDDLMYEQPIRALKENPLIKKAKGV